MRSIFLTLIVTLLPITANAAEPATDITARVELTLKTPRKNDPVLGGSREKVFFNIWIPAGVKDVCGAICNPFSKDEPASAHWKAACRHWQFAYVGVDFDGVKKDEYALIKSALTELAKLTKHPEVETMPFCFTGMSRGGGMSMALSELLPERTIASVPVCLEVGPESEATRHIPVLTIFGEKDGSQMEKLLGKLPTARKQDAQWCLAVQWNRKHEFGQANNLSFVFMDDVIARRVPKEIPLKKLNELSLKDGYIADHSTWKKTGESPQIHTWDDFKGDRAQSCWLPSQRTAYVWRAFVTGTKAVTISEPAGLGDGQKFELRSSSKAIPVKLAIDAKIKPAKVELWDADRLIAERVIAPWNFDVTLKPGIHSLYVLVHETGKEIQSSRPHTIVVGDE